MRAIASRRILAGVLSLGVGGIFVAASALTALADSPDPASLNATVSGSTVTISGTLTWSGGCKNNAGYGIVWNDANDPGLGLANASSVLVGLSSGAAAAGFDDASNLVHAAPGCAIGPISHTFSGNLPSQICAVGFHYDTSVTTGFHSKFEGGSNGDTDNSVSDSDKKNAPVVVPSGNACAQVVKKQPDVTITETGTPASTMVSDLITYHIVVSNLAGAAAATDQTQLLKDTLDANTQFVSVTPTSSWTNCTGSAASQVVTCSWAPSLAIGAATTEVDVVAKVLDRNESSVTNNAHVDDGAGNPDDANVNNQDAHVTTPVTSPMNITIDKSATPQVNVGDPITYTMTVTNHGAATTTSPVTVTDTLPAAVSFVSESGGDWNCPGAGQSLNCTYTGTGGALAPGATTGAITVTATALQAAVPSVTNTAFAHLANLTVQDSATTIVNTPVNLTLTKSAVPASGSDVSRGQVIDYTLHYSNTGTTAANGVTVTDTIPVGTTYNAGSAACTTAGCSAALSGNTITWSLNLPPSAAGEATFAVTVNSDDFNGEDIDNVANINFNGSHTPSNHTHHRVFVPSGSLQLVKSVNPTSVAVSTDNPNPVLTYTLVASAIGENQTGVVVTDVVPDGTTYVANSCTGGTSCSLSGDTVTWNLGNLDIGLSRTETFQVSINDAVNGTLPTEIINVGAIHSNETPNTPSNRVVVPLTQVLGVKIVKPSTPATPTTLPFTGLNSLQDALLAMVLIGGGLLLLTWPRLQSASRQAV